MSCKGWNTKSLTEGFWNFEKGKENEYTYRIYYFRGMSKKAIHNKIEELKKEDIEFVYKYSFWGIFRAKKDFELYDKKEKLELCSRIRKPMIIAVIVCPLILAMCIALSIIISKIFVPITCLIVIYYLVCLYLMIEYTKLINSMMRGYFMTIDEIMKERFSVRSFSNKAIEQEKLNEIIKMTRLAPTACNLQPQKIYVIKSDEYKEKIKSVCRMTFNAPIILLFCCDMDIVWKNKKEENYNTAEMDLSVVGTYAMLKAWDLGIGSCWVRAFKQDDIKNVLNLPENIKPISMMPIGYMAEDCEPNKNLHFSRKCIEEIIEYL